MSHFVVLCVLNAAHSAEFGRHPDRIDKLIEPMLAPFSEGREVDEYTEQCYCEWKKRHAEIERQFVAAHGVSQEDWLACRRIEHKAWCEANGLEHDVFNSPEKVEEKWRLMVSPLTAITERVGSAVEANPAEYADPECEECSGSGYRKTTYNPMSKWDWYQVGGRWTGLIDPTGYDPMDDPKNVHPCFHCQKRGKVPLTPGVISAWAGGEQMLSAIKDKDPARSELVASCKIAVETGGMSVTEAVKTLFPERAARITPDGNEIECWVCKGTGTQVAWPTQFARNEGDAQPVGVYKQLLARDPAKYTPYSLCIEAEGDGEATWMEKGQMGWFGMDTPHQSGDGWRDDVLHVIAGLDDNRIVVVVDCHI